MGQRDIRRLLIIGAMAVIKVAAIRRATESPWLGRMMARKPKLLVAVALANKMARGIWAMMTKGEDFRNPDRSRAELNGSSATVDALVCEEVDDR